MTLSGICRPSASLSTTSPQPRAVACSARSRYATHCESCSPEAAQRSRRARSSHKRIVSAETSQSACGTPIRRIPHTEDSAERKLASYSRTQDDAENGHEGHAYKLHQRPISPFVCLHEAHTCHTDIN